jgi:hypothetical protein
MMTPDDWRKCFDGKTVPMEPAEGLDPDPDREPTPGEIEEAREFTGLDAATLAPVLRFKRAVKARIRSYLARDADPATLDAVNREQAEFCASQFHESLGPGIRLVLDTVLDEVLAEPPPGKKAD